MIEFAHAVLVAYAVGAALASPVLCWIAFDAARREERAIRKLEEERASKPTRNARGQFTKAAHTSHARVYSMGRNTRRAVRSNGEPG